MARALVIEEQSGTCSGFMHPHNGYFAGDFHRAVADALPTPGLARFPSRPVRAPRRLIRRGRGPAAIPLDDSQRVPSGVPVRTEETTSVIARADAAAGPMSSSRPEWVEFTVR